ncbi:hypothetical protein [Cupriavidus campinensis]
MNWPIMKLGVVWGLVLFRERIALSAWIGIGCALTGTLLLLSGEIATLTGSPGGTLLGETPHWQDDAAIVLMFASLSSVMLAPLLRRRL